MSFEAMRIYEPGAAYDYGAGSQTHARHLRLVPSGRVGPFEGLTPQQAAMYEKHWAAVPAIVGRLARVFGMTPDEREESMGHGYEGLARAVADCDGQKASPAATTHGSWVREQIKGKVSNGLRDFSRGRSPSGQIANTKPSVMNGVLDSLDRRRQFTLSNGERAEVENSASADTTVDDEVAARVDLHMGLRRLRQRHSPRDCEIFFRRFFLDQELEEVGDAVGLKISRVVQILRAMSQDLEI